MLTVMDDTERGLNLLSFHASLDETETSGGKENMKTVCCTYPVV